MDIVLFFLFKNKSWLLHSLHSLFSEGGFSQTILVTDGYRGPIVNFSWTEILSKVSLPGIRKDAYKADKKSPHPFSLSKMSPWSSLFFADSVLMQGYRMSIGIMLFVDSGARGEAGDSKDTIARYQHHAWVSCGLSFIDYSHFTIDKALGTDPCIRQTTCHLMATLPSPLGRGNFMGWMTFESPMQATVWFSCQLRGKPDHSPQVRHLW